MASKTKSNTEKTAVPGGSVTRNVKTGCFVAVQTESGGKWPATRASASAVNQAAQKRHDALKRLADR